MSESLHDLLSKLEATAADGNDRAAFATARELIEVARAHARVMDLVSEVGGDRLGRYFAEELRSRDGGALTALHDRLREEVGT